MSLIIDIKVVPQSGRQQATFDKKGTLKILLKSAPEAGKANAELCKFLAKQLRLRSDDIKLLLGATSRKKRIEINADLSFEQLLEKLGIERQLEIG